MTYKDDMTDPSRKRDTTVLWKRDSTNTWKYWLEANAKFGKARNDG